MWPAGCEIAPAWLEVHQAGPTKARLRSQQRRLQRCALFELCASRQRRAFLWPQHRTLPALVHRQTCHLVCRAEAAAQLAERRAARGGPVLPAGHRRQVDAARFDEDASLNATRFVGLQGSLANSYSNALLQVGRPCPDRAVTPQAGGPATTTPCCRWEGLLVWVWLSAAEGGGGSGERACRAAWPTAAAMLCCSRFRLMQASVEGGGIQVAWASRRHRKRCSMQQASTHPHAGHGSKPSVRLAEPCPALSACDACRCCSWCALLQHMPDPQQGLCPAGWHLPHLSACSVRRCCTLCRRCGARCCGTCRTQRRTTAWWTRRPCWSACCQVRPVLTMHTVQLLLGLCQRHLLPHARQDHMPCRVQQHVPDPEADHSLVDEAALLECMLSGAPGPDRLHSCCWGCVTGSHSHSAGQDHISCRVRQHMPDPEPDHSHAVGCARSWPFTQYSFCLGCVAGSHSAGQDHIVCSVQQHAPAQRRTTAWWTRRPCWSACCEGTCLGANSSGDFAGGGSPGSCSAAQAQFSKAERQDGPASACKHALPCMEAGHEAAAARLGCLGDRRPPP